VRIHENGIDCPVDEIESKYRFFPFKSIRSVYFNQSSLLEEGERYRSSLMRGMVVLAEGRAFGFTISQTQNIVPVLQTLLKENWNDFIANIDGFDCSKLKVIKGGRSSTPTFVDPDKEYVYPKEYEWHPDDREEE